MENKTRSWWRARERRSRRGERDGDTKREHDVVIMEAQRFNNVTMNERAQPGPSKGGRRRRLQEPEDRRLNCKITERGTMRLGTTLCLHLNNPRARGYAYPRDFVLPLPSTHTPLYRVRLSRLCNSRALISPWKRETQLPFHTSTTRVCIYIYGEESKQRRRRIFTVVSFWREIFEALFFQCGKMKSLIQFDDLKM